MEDEYGSAEIDPKRLVSDLRKWKNEIKAKILMIESALITLEDWLEEQK